MSDDFLSKPLHIGGAGTSSSSSTAQRQQNVTAFSPYLNYDPRFLQQAQPEFIFPEGASKQRGRFELAFSQIGSSVMIGATLGGSVGLYNGIRATTLAQQTGKLRRTQLLNHVMKQGSATANTLGALSVMYSGFGVLLQYARGEDDEVNTIVAGTATGLLYKSTAGLQRCAIGGGVGFGVAALYCLYSWASSQGSSRKLNFYG